MVYAVSDRTIYRTPPRRATATESVRRWADALHWPRIGAMAFNVLIWAGAITIVARALRR